MNWSRSEAKADDIDDWRLFSTACSVLRITTPSLRLTGLTQVPDPGKYPP
jgi:hypothetical protein